MSTDLSADKKVGARIRYFREQQGIKQKELAQDIHVSPSFLNRIEKGTVRLTLDYICSICDVLNINPRDVLCDILVRDTDATQNLSDEITFLIESLLSSEQSKILNILKLLYPNFN